MMQYFWRTDNNFTNLLSPVMLATL